jgi:putative ABC transport system permease protein
MIWRLATRNLRSSPLRLVLISLAIILGVGFVSGAFVLGDTISKAFDDLFAKVNQNVAVQVQGVASVSSADRQPVPASVLPKVLAVDGVASADGTAGGTATIVGSNGKTIGQNGPPTLGFGWVTGNGRTTSSTLTLVSGSAPLGPDDVVIDTHSAQTGKFHLGQKVRVITSAGIGEFILVGTVRFGSSDNLLGATLSAFAMPTAQRLFGLVGKYTSINVTGKQGVLDATLATRVQAVLPPGYEAITGASATKQASDQFNSIVGILRDVLLVFAGIALFVGAFIIFNSFSITIAQRTRQVGLLRAVGASRGAIVGEVVVEALIIGIVASIIGVGFGIIVAMGLEKLFDLFGASLPKAPIQVQPRTIIVGLVIGIGVTLVAALRPAIRASRIPPIAALRDAVQVSVHSLRRLVVSVVVTGLGVALVLVGLFSGAGNPYLMLGLGALLLFIGAAMLTEQIAKPLARFIGAPMILIGRVPARLGRENAMRNPGRTAQTATALTIGVALVTAATIFAASLYATFAGTLDQRLRAQVVVQSANQQPFTPAAAAALDAVPELSAVSAWRVGEFRDVHRDVHSVSGINPSTILDVYDAGLQSGSFADLAQPGTIAVQKDYAKTNHLTVGSRMPAFFAKTGIQPFRVAAIFSDSTFGLFFISLNEYVRNFSTQQDTIILARAAPGVSAGRAKQAVTSVMAPYPNLTVYTKAGYKDQVNSQINQLLYLVYTLLGLAVIIAIFGIVNTLALSIFERTREIRLLRAVGLSRRATRAMIRWEAIIVALIGGVVGLILGAFIGIVVVKRVPMLTTLSVPWTSLIVFLVLAGVAGVVAAIFPARRAARINVLDAIQAD